VRVVVVGATGNAGTSVLRALARDDAVDDVVGIARRLPRAPFEKARFVTVDIGNPNAQLVGHFRDADAVIHLAWLIQPSRHEDVTRAVNVEGSARVFRAVAEAGVPALIYASSVGAYAPGPKDTPVDESWPATGIDTSFYARHKAEVERILDGFERENPSLRVVRMRPGLLFKREAASGIRRLFAGPLLPRWLMRPSLIPVVPDIPRLRFQALHTDDAGEAYRLAVHADVRGAFNLAADPVLDPRQLARLLGARRVPLPAGVARGLASLSWRLRLQPTPEGWLDLALGVPIMDTTRARTELGWRPARDSGQALLELIDGLREGAGAPTPPLDPTTGGPVRLRELLTGVGARSA
jgi:UDP-glucose 4-epimerase